MNSNLICVNAKEIEISKIYGMIKMIGGYITCE